MMACQEARRANRLGEQHGHCRNTQETENLHRPKRRDKAIKREHFPMKTIEEVVQNMPGAKVFSKLDATRVTGS